MKTAAGARAVVSRLEALYPDADTELRHSNAYQLLVATVLSAQTSDARVNEVTPVLFGRYPDARALSAAEPAEIEPLVRSTGFFRSKARTLHRLARELVARHGGEVPATMEALTALPGVGRKTANVVLGHAFDQPGLPVDRHVLRVANRIGLARSGDPEVVERQIGRLVPSETWVRLSDALILHGRRVCRPRPVCDQCSLRSLCEYDEEKGRKKAPARAGRGG